VVYARSDAPSNCNALRGDWDRDDDPRAIMVLARLSFGYAVTGASVLPRWTG
jgi:hypothetical protein